VNAAKPGKRPTRGEKHDKALQSGEAKLSKKPNPKKSLGSHIRDILKGNS
jgi:hypothetical protein